jgi:methyl-accepting chemotaxis protein
MKFRAQILLYGLAGVCFAGVVGGIGLLTTRGLGRNLESATLANQALHASQSADMMHDAIRADTQQAALGALGNQPERIAQASKGLKEHIATFTRNLETIRGLPLSKASQDALAAVEPVVGKYFRAAEQAVDAAGIGGASATANGQALQAAFTELEGKMAVLSESIAKTGVEFENQAKAGIGQAELSIGIALLAAAVSMAAAAIWMTRAMTRQLGGDPAVAADLARCVAQGNLNGHVDLNPGDTQSLMAQLATMQASLAKVVGNVRQNAEGVATASAQIAQGNQDLSQRTEAEASALEETAASMEELGSTVKQNADNATQANQLALGASTVAIKGGEVVSQVVETMKGINDSSRRIADIISVIDGIAFQTNILALNAAVEAARAGEQGRGFAVVASEVRSLAGRSADAAKEIKSLITASVERVEQGTALVDQAGATMKEVVSSIKRVTDIMGEISAASSEQSAGVSQVSEAVSQMDRVTQKNAALVEESAAAAESLKGQARQLVQAVAVFKLSHRDGAVTSTDAAAPAANAPLVERRGPSRAQNVTRPAFRAKPVAPAPATAATLVASASSRTGTCDRESF